MTPQQIYQWLVELIAKWPETKVTMTWGEPHFRVGDKIFSGWGAHKDGRYSMGIKLDKDKQAAFVASDPRFAIAPYVGKHGWVSFHPGDEPDLGEVEALLLESYRNVAPRTLVAKLDAGWSGGAAGEGTTSRLAARGKPTARRSAAAEPKQAGRQAKPAAKPAGKRAKLVGRQTKPVAKPAGKQARPGAKPAGKRAKPAAEKAPAKQAKPAKPKAPAKPAKPKARAKPQAGKPRS